MLRLYQEWAILALLNHSGASRLVTARHFAVPEFEVDQVWARYQRDLDRLPRVIQKDSLT